MKKEVVLFLALFISLVILTLFIRAPGEKGNKKDIKLRLSYWIPFIIGIRLLLAGITQICKPSYTAKLHNIHPDCNFVIRELGFANIVLGLLGISQILIKETHTRALISGSLALFFIECTIQHITAHHLKIAILDSIQSIMLVSSTVLTLNL